MPKSRNTHALEREKWLQGELSEEARNKLEKRLGRADLDAMRREDEALRVELMTNLPPEVLAARVRARVAESRASPVAAARWMMPAVAAVLLVSVWQWRAD